MSTTDVQQRQVFLSYAQEDKEIASRIAGELRHAGLRVFFDAWELAAGDSIAERMDQALHASDVVLILLSRSAAASDWVQREFDAALSTELKDRAITVIPALIEDCEIPPLLADRVYLDLRKDLVRGVRRLAEQLDVTPDLDFSRLDARSFESLVGDLLRELGFSVDVHSSHGRDDGIDFVASYRSRDPFGAERTETWLATVKFYRTQRVSVQALREMLALLQTSSRARRGLIVTNSRLTSVARDFLTEIGERSGYELRVIDETELIGLLLQRPELVRRYFSQAPAHE